MREGRRSVSDDIEILAAQILLLVCVKSDQNEKYVTDLMD